MYVARDRTLWYILMRLTCELARPILPITVLEQRDSRARASTEGERESFITPMGHGLAIKVDFFTKGVHMQMSIEAG